MSAADLLDAALQELRVRTPSADRSGDLTALLAGAHAELLFAVKEWARAERRVRAANAEPFQMNQKLTDVADAQRRAADRLLPAVTLVEQIEKEMGHG